MHMANDEGLFLITAQLAAHERLIRDLLLVVFGQRDEPVQSFDHYSERLLNALSTASARGVDPARSDVLVQLISEAVGLTLKEARRQLVELAAQAAQQKKEPS